VRIQNLPLSGFGVARFVGTQSQQRLAHSMSTNEAKLLITHFRDRSTGADKVEFRLNTNRLEVSKYAAMADCVERLLKDKMCFRSYEHEPKSPLWIGVVIPTGLDLGRLEDKIRNLMELGLPEGVEPISPKDVATPDYSEAKPDEPSSGVDHHEYLLIAESRAEDLLNVVKAMRSNARVAEIAYQTPDAIRLAGSKIKLLQAAMQAALENGPWGK